MYTFLVLQATARISYQAYMNSRRMDTIRKNLCNEKVCRKCATIGKNGNQAIRRSCAILGQFDRCCDITSKQIILHSFLI